ncbi:MAG: GIY-YIG nuclease family protein [Candidatus Marinimicrobia bacterium]|nr:GIY-YIG nuclease family protein [Candidatus Neomarinimicrobiota bacterium]
MKSYYVYIMSSLSKRLYVGVTSNLLGRVWQHKQKKIDGFTKRYNITKLVWYEETNDVYAALEYERKIKKWRREKKIILIEKKNYGWLDLSENWYDF